MNTITADERARLVAAAKTAITLDADGDIHGGFEAAWRTFAETHQVSNDRARRYVAQAARLLRGKRASPGPGRPASVQGAPITVFLAPGHVAMAARLGDGNISAGIRRALEDWPWPSG